MNYLRDIDNFDEEMDDLFNRFVEHVNQQDDPNFQLNQSIINNAYSIRRTMELNQTGTRRSTIPEIRYTINENDNRPHTPPSLTPPRTYIPQLNEYGTLNELNDIDLANEITNNILSSLFTNFNEFMQNEMQNEMQEYDDLEDVKVTLSEDEFNNLETKISEDMIINKQCNICLEDLILDKETSFENKLINLKCNHIYHRDCIKEWLTKQSTKCPTCRCCYRSV